MRESTEREVLAIAIIVHKIQGEIWSSDKAESCTSFNIFNQGHLDKERDE